MTRQIKFRAWDGKEMIEKPVVSSFDWNKGSSGGTHDTLMQFTGLLDKNGKEIYEGDILKHDLWGNCQIIWEHGMFRGQSKDEKYDFTLADYQRDRQRIVGNIYENPNLLK